MSPFYGTMKFFLYVLPGLAMLETSLQASAQQDDVNDMHARWVQAYHQSQANITNLSPTIRWQPDSKHYTFRASNDQGWTWMVADATQSSPPQPAFDHKRMAHALNKLLKRKYPPTRIPLQDLTITTDGVTFRTGKRWLRFSNNQLSPSSAPKSSPKKKNHSQHIAPRERSPDGKWRAFVKDGSIFLTEISSQQTRELAQPKQKGSYYHGKPVWNPQSTSFYIYHTEPGQRRTVTIVESSPKDQLQPKLHRFRYDKPGDKIDRNEPHLFNIKGKTPHKPNHSFTKDAFSIRHAQWNDRGDTMIYEYIERGYGKHYLIAMDAETGSQKLLAKEESDTFIYTGYVRFRKDLHKTQEIIWGSERDGWRHLYLLDAETGKTKYQITQGPWVVRKVIHVDTTKREIVFTASGRNPKEDPYHIHWYRVGFDGSNLTPLTQADGTHQLTFSPDKKYYIDSWSRVDHPTVHELHRSNDGKKIREILRADASKLVQSGRHLPERFVCKDRNNRFDIHGIIIKPPHFDPKKQYPVIENIYAGPHGAFVPKKFHPWHGGKGDLAEEGFIVVQIDALGTNYRHRDFSHFAYKNLVDSGFPDRIKWIREAAKTRPYMDISRVGIYGGSAGGQSSTAAMLHHGQFYKAAVSDCGCHDNRMDKIWWNEQWMDWPIGPHYAKQSNITNAHKLQGALMLTVGELDKNVDPSSTTQLVNALIKANKTFTHYIIPGAGHGAGESNYFRCKRAMFFKQHLGGPKERN